MNMKSVFPHISSSVKADNTVKMIGDVYIGENVQLQKNVIVDGSKGRIVIGKNSVLKENVKIIANGERLKIGENVTIESDIVVTQNVSDNEIVSMST